MTHSYNVFMFPGLGAEYPNMLSVFCKQYDWAEKTVKQWEAATGITILNAHACNTRDTEYHRQIQIHCMNLLWWKAAHHRSESTTSIFCGHSLGFYAAVVASGLMDEEDSFTWLTTIFNESWREFASNRNRIAVFTSTVAIDAHRLAKQFGVEVIARNSLQQIVIYGSQQQIDTMSASLEWASLRYSDLGTVIPYHSIVMGDVCQQLNQLDALPVFSSLSPANNEVWSHLSGEKLVDHDAIRNTLLNQPMRTVNWQRLIENLNHQYSPEYIEIGPNRILSQLVRWTDPQAKVSHIDHLRRSNLHKAGKSV